MERIEKDLELLREELNERLCEEHSKQGNVELFACYHPKKK